MAHTYNSTYRDFTAALEGLHSWQRAEVYCAESEALGYARGRMDAQEDHNLPRTFAIEPVIFARLYGIRYARNLATGGCEGNRRPLRESWELYVLDEL